MKTDYDVLHIIFKCGKILGMTTPWKEKESHRLELLRKCYNIFLIILTIVAVICSGFSKYYGFWQVLPSTTQMVLEVLQFLAELCFFMSCFLGSITNAKRWMNIFATLKDMDFLLKKHNYSSKVSVVWYGLAFLIINLSYVILHVYEIISWQGEEDVSMENGYILDRVLMYYQIYLTVLIFILNKVVKRRYWILVNFLVHILERKKKNIIICQEANSYFLEKIFLIKDMFANLHLIMANFNKIFGWPIFFSIVSNVFLCLVNVNYIFLFSSTHNSSFNTSIFVSAALYTGVYTVSI